MALQGSGAISFNNINQELGVAGTTTASLNQASYRTLAGVASGQISMSNFYGKSNIVNNFFFVWYQATQTQRESVTPSQQVGEIADDGTGRARINGVYMAYNFTRNYYNPALYFNQIATYGYPNLGQNFFNSITGNGLTLYTSNAVYEYYGSNPSLNRWSWFSANNTLLPLVFGVNHGYIPGGLYYN